MSDTNDIQARFEAAAGQHHVDIAELAHLCLRSDDRTELKQRLFMQGRLGDAGLRQVTVLHIGKVLAFVHQVGHQQPVVQAAKDRTVALAQRHAHALPFGCGHLQARKGTQAKFSGGVIHGTHMAVDF